MNKRTQTHLFITASYLVGITAFILILISLNRSYNGYSIKQLWELLGTRETTIVKYTATMAYIGSIITLCLSIALLLYTGYLTYNFFVAKSDILFDRNIMIILLTIIILIGLVISCVIPSSNITNHTWLLEHDNQR